MFGHDIAKRRSGIIVDGYAGVCLDELLATQENSPYLDSTTDEDGELWQQDDDECRVSLFPPIRMEDLLQDEELWEQPLKLDAKQLEGIREYFENGFFEGSPIIVPPEIASVTTKVIEKAKDAVAHCLTKYNPVCCPKERGSNCSLPVFASLASTSIDHCVKTEVGDANVEDAKQLRALRDYLCKTHLDRAERGAFKIPTKHVDERMQTFLNAPKDKSPRLVMDKKQLDEFCEIFNLEYDYAEFASEASKVQAATAIEKAKEIVESRIKQLAGKIGALEAKIQASPTSISRNPFDTCSLRNAVRDVYSATQLDELFPPDVLRGQQADTDDPDTIVADLHRGVCNEDSSPATPCKVRQHLFSPRFRRPEEDRQLRLQGQPQQDQQQHAETLLGTSTQKNLCGLLSKSPPMTPPFGLAELEEVPAGDLQERRKKKKKRQTEGQPSAEHTDELSRLSNETLADLMAAEQLPEQFLLELLPSNDTLLTTPVDSLVEQLQHMHLVYNTREAHFRAILTRHQLATQLIRTRATQLSTAMHRLSERVQHTEAQQALQHRHEDQLREQLRLYVEKFKQVEQTLTRSNDLFVSFRKEMEQMSAKLGKLEKDNQLLQTKNAALSRNIVEMVDERAKQAAAIDALTAQKAKLASLCRTMQNERNVALGRVNPSGSAATASQGSTGPK